MKLPHLLPHKKKLSIKVGSFPFLGPLNQPFSFGPKELFYHLHIIGKSGFGKSKWLANYATGLILAGQACSVIDPDSDLALDTLHILLERGYFKRPDAMERVLYIDFSNRERFIPFNVLKQRYPVDQTARNLVEACMRAWPSLSGGAAPQFENLLLCAANVLIDNELPLTHLDRLLNDEEYCARLLHRVRDPKVIDFFRNRYSSKKGAGLSGSTLRREFLLTYSPSLRYTLGQRDNALDFRTLVDRGVSVILNLGGLDGDTQKLLGCLLTVGFEQAAFSRADVRPEWRRPHHLVIDEFHHFVDTSSEALDNMLVRSRKYGLFLSLAHQTASQVTKVRGALQNTIPIAFHTGEDDADWVASRIGSISSHHVKYRTRNRAVLASKTEQQAEWAHLVHILKRGEALVKLGNKTYQFNAVRVPSITPLRHQELKKLCAQYAELLCTQKDRIALPGSVLSQTIAHMATKNHPTRFLPLPENSGYLDDDQDAPIIPLENSSDWDQASEDGTEAL